MGGWLQELSLVSEALESAICGPFPPPWSHRQKHNPGALASWPRQSVWALGPRPTTAPQLVPTTSHGSHLLQLQLPAPEWLTHSLNCLQLQLQPTHQGNLNKAYPRDSTWYLPTPAPLATWLSPRSPMPTLVPPPAGLSKRPSTQHMQSTEKKLLDTATPSRPGEFVVSSNS